MWGCVQGEGIFGLALLQSVETLQWIMDNKTINGEWKQPGFMKNVLNGVLQGSKAEIALFLMQHKDAEISNEQDSLSNALLGGNHKIIQMILDAGVTKITPEVWPHCMPNLDIETLELLLKKNLIQADNFLFLTAAEAGRYDIIEHFDPKNSWNPEEISRQLLISMGNNRFDVIWWLIEKKKILLPKSLTKLLEKKMTSCDFKKLCPQKKLGEKFFFF
jgi:hypothetical protein